MEVIKVSRGFEIPGLNMKIVKTTRGYKIEGGTAGEGYIRIGDLQICWGQDTINTNEGGSGTSGAGTWAMPFSENPEVTITETGGYSGRVSIDRTTTGYSNIFLAESAPSSTRIVMFIAIGKWE